MTIKSKHYTYKISPVMAAGIVIASALLFACGKNEEKTDKIKPHMDVLFDPDIEESILDMIKTNIKTAQVPG